MMVVGILSLSLSNGRKRQQRLQAHCFLHSSIELHLRQCRQVQNLIRSVSGAMHPLAHSAQVSFARRRRRRAADWGTSCWSGLTRLFSISQFLRRFRLQVKSIFYSFWIFWNGWLEGNTFPSRIQIKFRGFVTVSIRKFSTTIIDLLPVWSFVL